MGPWSDASCLFNVLFVPRKRRASTPDSELEFVMAQAPDQAPLLGEQPDVVELPRSISDISVQVGRFCNMPAIAGGDRILEGIERMKTELSNQITEVKTELTASITEVKTELQCLRTSIHTSLQALNTNIGAQFINNQNVRARTHTIKALVNVTTGNDIPNFPPNINAIMSLSSTFPLPSFLSHQG
jgi:hypothetical protein